MSLWKKKNKSLSVALPKAEPQKPSRTLEEIQTQYGQYVAELGQKTYHIKCLQDEVEFLMRTVRDLNQEAAIVKQKESADKAAAETKYEDAAVEALRNA